MYVSQDDEIGHAKLEGDVEPDLAVSHVLEVRHWPLVDGGEWKSHLCFMKHKSKVGLLGRDLRSTLPRRSVHHLMHGAATVAPQAHRTERQLSMSSHKNGAEDVCCYMYEACTCTLEYGAIR